MFSNFGLDQIWQQLKHHTEKTNSKTVNKLSNLTLNEEFTKQLDEINQNEEEEEESEQNEDENDSQGEEGPEDDEMSEGYKAMMK